jgi:hypothetical protein
MQISILERVNPHIYYTRLIRRTMGNFNKLRQKSSVRVSQRSLNAGWFAKNLDLLPSEHGDLFIGA